MKLVKDVLGHGHRHVTVFLSSPGSDSSTIEIHIASVSRNGKETESVPKAQGDL